MFDDNGDIIDDSFQLYQVRSFCHDTDEGFCPRRADKNATFIAQFFFTGRNSGMMRLLSSQPDFV